MGVLTEALARQGASVIAVEIDTRLVALLRKRLARFPGVSIVHADILTTTPEQLLRDDAGPSKPAPAYIVVANLPYYITSPVLSHFLEKRHRPSRMVVMVQKEVGETIAAVPGKMRLLSVRTQFYSRPAIVCRVPATSFQPQPKVDSVVLRLDVYSEPPIDVSDVDGFFEFVAHGFSAPRKQIRNSLAHSLDMPNDRVALLLGRGGVDATRRAETLSLDEWKDLWHAFGDAMRGSKC